MTKKSSSLSWNETLMMYVFHRSMRTAFELIACNFRDSSCEVVTLELWGVSLVPRSNRRIARHAFSWKDLAAFQAASPTEPVRLALDDEDSADGSSKRPAHSALLVVVSINVQTQDVRATIDMVQNEVTDQLDGANPEGMLTAMSMIVESIRNIMKMLDEASKVSCIVRNLKLLRTLAQNPHRYILSPKWPVQLSPP